MSNSKFTFKSRVKKEHVLTTEELRKNQEEISKWLDQKDRTSRIILKEAMNRNVIFVGKSRSGKSTALEVLKNALFFVQQASIFAETGDPRITHFTVEVEGEDKYKANFNIGVIDTPGLFELTDSGATSRDIETLEELILKCMQAEITKIHAIFFVVAQTGTINPQDVEALKHFISLFRGAHEHIHILVTKAEDLSDAGKEKIKSEFSKAEGLKELLNQVGTIHFTGAVPQTLFDNGFIEPIKHQFTNVELMREELFETIFNCDHPFELHSIGMSSNVRSKAATLYTSLKKTFESSSPPNLPNPASFKEACKRLHNWLPVLNHENREEIKSFLEQVEKHLLELEHKVATKSQMHVDDDNGNDD